MDGHTIGDGIAAAIHIHNHQFNQIVSGVVVYM